MCMHVRICTCADMCVCMYRSVVKSRTERRRTVSFLLRNMEVSSISYIEMGTVTINILVLYDCYAYQLEGINSLGRMLSAIISPCMHACT